MVRYLKLSKIWTQQKPVGTKDVIRGSTRSWASLNLPVESSHPTSSKPCSAPASSHSKHLLFPPGKCLFCCKKSIKKQPKKKHLTKSFPDWSHKSSGCQISEKWLRKCKTKATVPCIIRLLALICLQLRHIFINPVITILTANSKHLKDIISQNQQK